MRTGKPLPAIFSVLFILAGISGLLEGEIGFGVLLIYAGVATIPEKNISRKTVTVKYLIVILLGVASLFIEMKMWIPCNNNHRIDCCDY
ncbi:MAG: hypothetical protein PWR09_341 [Archaeoglobi archaeon]|nr:hypothetical protein [Archaeoglobi archaeon]